MTCPTRITAWQTAPACFDDKYNRSLDVCQEDIEHTPTIWLDKADGFSREEVRTTWQGQPDR